MTKSKISTLLLMAGASTVCYAYARYTTTRTLLTSTDRIVRQFLIEQDKFDDEAKELLGRLYATGGMYYWWNSALWYLGLGVLMAITGLLVPFVRKRPQKRELRRRDV